MIAGEGTYDPEEAAAQVRAGVVERLRARRTEIDEAIFARVSDRWFDRTGSEDPEYVAGLRAAGVAALDYVFVGIERSGRSLAPVPGAVLEQARRAARTGVGLDTVLRRYLAGYGVLEGFVMQEAEHDENDRIPPAPTSALRDLLQILSTLVDRLITAVSHAYGEELEPAGEVVRRRRKVRSGASIQNADRSEIGQHRRSSPSQRDRILQAMVELAAEHGFEHVTVKLLTGRAGVSTRTFYEEFDDLQDCFVVVLDLALARAGETIAQAFMRERRWQDGLLGAIASLLVFLESEPLLARVWFVEAMVAGSWALERREQIAEALRFMVVEYWAGKGEERPDPVATAGVMAAVLGLVQTHLVTGQSGPLIELLGPLMGLVTSLRLEKGEVTREVQRAAQVAREIEAGDTRWISSPAPAAKQDIEPGAAADVTLFTNLGNATARHLRACVLYLAEQGALGGCPSNREIGTAIGTVHKSQISKLLSQLQEQDLAVKRSIGPGKPNEWTLTPRGEEIARALVEQKH